MKPHAMRIFGDKISGNCLKVKWVCDHLTIPYEWVEVDILGGGTRTPEFFALNAARQVPVVEFADGRTLAQSNAIIRYLAEGSHLIPKDRFDAAKMEEWMYWEQYSHEPYIAVCRFQMKYLGRPAEELDPERVKRGYAALDRMELHLASNAYLVGKRASLADIALLAYTRVAPEGGFDLMPYPHIRRWAGETKAVLG